MTARDDESVSDARLAEALATGSRRALRCVYDRYGPELYRLACRVTGDEEVAKDVVQDLFVGLPEAMSSYEERGRFAAWLRTVLLNLARGTVRNARSDTVELDRAPQRAPGANPADRVVDRELLREAMDELSPALRTVFVLKEMEDHSHEEIAEMLGLSPGTSRVRLHRAKKELRQTLGKAGHDR